MSKLNKRKLARILLILFMLLAVVAFYFVPGVRSKVTQVLMLFRSMSVESIVGYLRSFGIWAVVISFLLMMFQSIIAPLPAFLITFANAAVFGWWQGALLSWTSAMAGALVCFYIARIAGRDIVERLNKNFSLESLDAYFDRYGKHTILICRLLPFISFDFVSYAAGYGNQAYTVLDCHRNWTITSDSCLFVCWQQSNRQYENHSVWFAKYVCAVHRGVRLQTNLSRPAGKNE